MREMASERTPEKTAEHLMDWNALPWVPSIAEAILDVLPAHDGPWTCESVLAALLRRGTVSEADGSAYIASRMLLFWDETYKREAIAGAIAKCLEEGELAAWLQFPNSDDR